MKNKDGLRLRARYIAISKRHGRNISVIKKKTRDYEKELDRGMQPREGTGGIRRRATGVSCRSTRGPG